MLRLNGVKIDEDPKLITHALFTLFPDINYWSKDALDKLYIEVFTIGVEAANELERRGYTRFVKDAKKRIKLFKDTTGEHTRSWSLQRIYEEILRVENLNTLPHFGFANKFGDPIWGNSERQSLLGTPLYIQKEELTMALKRSELIKAAKELNDVMGLEPAIDIQLKITELQEKIIEAAKFIDPVGDKFSKATDAVLATLNAIPEEEAEVIVPEKSKPTETKEAEVVPETPEELTALVTNTKKLAELKEIVNTYDDFKKLRKGLDAFQGLSGPRELKPVMLKALGVEGPTAKAKDSTGKKAYVSKSGPSNKQNVYIAWKNGEHDSGKLWTSVKEAVKINTIKVWISAWTKGKNLPAGVTE